MAGWLSQPGWNRISRRLVALRVRTFSRRLRIGVFRKVGGQVINNRVELSIGAIGAPVYHAGNDLLPALLCIAVAQDNFRSMTSGTNPLNGVLTRTIGQLW